MTLSLEIPLTDEQKPSRGMARFLFEDSQGLYCMALAGSEEKARRSALIQFLRRLVEKNPMIPAADFEELRRLRIERLEKAQCRKLLT